MSLTVKLFGIILIISAATALGFYKASKITEEERLIFEICRSLKELREKIRLNFGEMDAIIPLCFSESILKLRNGDIIFTAALSPCDRNALREYFSSAGMGDIESETARADTYIAIFEARLEDEKKKTRDLCKLYRSLGFLCGLFLSVFLV